MNRYLEDNELPELVIQIKNVLDGLDKIKGNYHIIERNELNDKAIIFEAKENLRTNKKLKNILTVWVSGTPKIRAIGSHKYNEKIPFNINDLNSQAFHQDLISIYRNIIKQ